jgi:hypothetical protein
VNTQGATSTSTSQQLVTEVVSLLMRLRGDRQHDLAAVLGVVRPAVTARLNNRSPWALDDLDALAAYFGVTPATFLVPTQLLLGGGGERGDQVGLVPPLDVSQLVQAASQGPDARRRRQRGTRSKDSQQRTASPAAQLQLVPVVEARA